MKLSSKRISCAIKLNLFGSFKFYLHINFHYLLNLKTDATGVKAIVYKPVDCSLICKDK